MPLNRPSLAVLRNSGLQLQLVAAGMELAQAGPGTGSSEVEGSESSARVSVTKQLPCLLPGLVCTQRGRIVSWVDLLCLLARPQICASVGRVAAAHLFVVQCVMTNPKKNVQQVLQWHVVY
jgi:hypothetical protein